MKKRVLYIKPAVIEGVDSWKRVSISICKKSKNINIGFAK